MIDDSVIRLREYTPSPVQLDVQERNFLHDRFSRKIGHWQEFRDGGVVDLLDPGPQAGVITLPSGRRLECRPKIEAANVFYMMAIAYDVPEFLPESADFESMEEV